MRPLQVAAEAADARKVREAVSLLRRLPWPVLVQVIPVMSWLVLLWGSVAPAQRVFSPELALCLVTLSTAGSRAWRAVAEPVGRVIWALMAVGLGGYALGFVVLFQISTGEAGGPFGVNYSDCFSLLLYPAGYLALLTLTRERLRSWRSSALLDGAIVALATSAAALAWAVATYPSLIQGSAWNVVYALAYPVGGATLLIVAVTGLAMARWQIDRCWALVLSGFLVMTVGDAVYGLQSAAGTFQFGTPVDAAYTAGPVLVALASWRDSTRSLRRPARASVAMVVPAAATVVALVLLVVDHFWRLSTPAVLLSSAAVLLAIGRTGFFLRQEGQLAQVRRDAETDHLTGLPNRRALLATLQRRLNEDWAGVDLLLLDLDGFKEINDTLGHGAGDRLLSEVADRLSAVSDVTVARLGGDEFAVVVDLRHGSSVERAQHLRAGLLQPLVIDGYKVAVAASIGIAGTEREPDPERLTPEELLRRADVALYRAKRRRSGVESWTPTLDIGALDRLQLLAELRIALAGDTEIIVHLQPQVHPVTRQVLGIEALVRWQHPRRGLLTPGDFLEVVEQSGLLPQLTRRVVQLVLTHQACQPEGAPPVSINLGAPDLLRSDFASWVAEELAGHRLAAGCVRFEVTEGVVMSDPERILRTLHELRSVGIALSLDDYGTGLSSLSYLRLIPVSELKIDRSFVQRLTSDPSTALIVASTIALAHGLGLTVVAEGVEDEPTLRALIEADCDVVQGYLLGRPAPAGGPVSPAVPGQRQPLAAPNSSSGPELPACAARTLPEV